MSASHMQVVRAGPVQPIGLPINVMGVTNARVLHRRILNSDVANNSMGLLVAKRCLFGSPEPGEIQSMYKDEMRRNREHFIQRYNYDILNERFLENSTDEDRQEQQAEDTGRCNRNQELAAAARLQEDKIAPECPPTPKKSAGRLNKVKSPNCDNEECNLNKIQNLTITKDIRTATPASPPNVGSPTSSPTFKDRKLCERLKPYARQNFITEYYNTRKSAIISQAIEVRQLPKPQKAKLHNDQEQRILACDDV